MLKENLERTFAGDSYEQMGRYIKRCLGLQVYSKMAPPGGERIQKWFAGNERREPGRYYEAAFVTSQGVPEKCVRHRGNRSERIIDVLQAYRSGIDRCAWRFKGHS